jgi:hypothetical protein
MSHAQQSSSSALKSFRVAALLTCTLPVILYFVYATWLDPVSPYFANYDPEFPYLMNSLQVFKGRPYTYVDHPGTPLELVGSAIYAVTYPILGASSNAFVRYHLSHPGLFLTLSHILVLFASLGCIWIIYSASSADSNRERAMLAAAVAILYFAVHPLAFAALTIWSHNSFSFAFGTLLLILVFRVVSARAPTHRLPRRLLITVGLCAGVLAAITIYLASWIVSCLVIVSLSYRLRNATWTESLTAGLLVGLSSVVGFFLAVLPALGGMPQFFVWIGALLTHENTYLLGDPNQPLLARWASNIVELSRELPILLVATIGLLVLAGSAFVRWRARASEQPGHWATIGGSILQVALLTGFIIDHPKPEYMLAVAATLPALAIPLLDLFQFDVAVSRRLNRMFTALVLICFGFSFFASVWRHHVEADRIAGIVQQTAQSRDDYARTLGRVPADLVVLWAYRSYSPCFSLWFGNDSTGRVFRKEIGELCYRQYQLHIWSQKVVSAKGVAALDATKWDMIIGCEDAFRIPVLADLPHITTFPQLQLECGSLMIAHNLQ